MSDAIKLYKCIKGTCSKCLNEENPYITEDEYKDLLDADGKIQCPEGHLECGIQEVNPNDLPKPKTQIDKKLVFIGGGVLLVLLIGIGSYFLFVNKSKAKDNAVSKTETAQALNTGNTVKKDTEAINSSASNQPIVSNPVGESTPVATHNGKVSNSEASGAQQVSATTLQDHFVKLADKNIPYPSKKGIKQSIQKYFTPNAQIVEVNNNGDAMKSGETVEDYAERLCTSHRYVEIRDKEMIGDKISVLKVKTE